MATTGLIHVRIVADTRQFRAALIRAQLRMTRSRWKRLRLRYELRRVYREKAPA